MESSARLQCLQQKHQQQQEQHHHRLPPLHSLMSCMPDLVACCLLYCNLIIFMTKSETNVNMYNTMSSLAGCFLYTLKYEYVKQSLNIIIWPGTKIIAHRPQTSNCIIIGIVCSESCIIMKIIMNFGMKFHFLPFGATKLRDSFSIHYSLISMLILQY